MDGIYGVYAELIGHSGEITSINYRNNILVSGSKDCNVIVWKCNRNEIMKYRVFNGHTDVVQSVIVSDCGLYVISGSWDAIVRIWNIEDDKCVHVLYGHTKEVMCCSIIENYIISSSKDGTIKTWDLYTGQCDYSIKPDQVNEWIDTCRLIVKDNTLEIYFSTSNGCFYQIKHPGGFNSLAQESKGTKEISTTTDNFKMLMFGN